MKRVPCRDGDEKMARQLFVSDKTVLNRRDEYFDFAFNDKAFSDVKVVCGDREFDCHRVILSSQSSVPCSSTIWRRRRTGVSRSGSSSQRWSTPCWSIFFYTGDKTKSEMTTPGEMLLAADMYDLEDLKAHCEEVLIKSMHITNCIDCLVLGDMNNAMQWSWLWLIWEVLSSLKNGKRNWSVFLYWCLRWWRTLAVSPNL